MNPYDNEKVQAVWQRVMQKSEPAGNLARPPLESGHEPLDRVLWEMIRAEYASAGGYVQMSKQAKTYSRVFQHMAMEERQHAHRLSVLYELLYGNKPNQSPEPAERVGSFREAVRYSFQAERKAAERYRKAAEDWPEHRALFEHLAADEQRHSRKLLHIACQL